MGEKNPFDFEDGDSNRDHDSNREREREREREDDKSSRESRGRRRKKRSSEKGGPSGLTAWKMALVIWGPIVVVLFAIASCCGGLLIWDEITAPTELDPLTQTPVKTRQLRR